MLGDTLEGKHSGLLVHECVEMEQIKAVAKQLFSSSCGGSYKVWDVWLLAQELMDYCCNAHKLKPRRWKMGWNSSTQQKLPSPPLQTHHRQTTDS
jgi:hypothetical protein